jgi:hypothetical protein
MCNILHHPPSPSPSLRRRHSLLEAGAHPFAFYSVHPSSSGSGFPFAHARTRTSRNLTLTLTNAPHTRAYIFHAHSAPNQCQCVPVPAPSSIHPHVVCCVPYIHSHSRFLISPLWTPVLFCSVLFLLLSVVIYHIMPFVIIYPSTHHTHIYSGSVYLTHSTTYLSYLCPR